MAHNKLVWWQQEYLMTSQDVYSASRALKNACAKFAGCCFLPNATPSLNLRLKPTQLITNMSMILKHGKSAPALKFSDLTSYEQFSQEIACKSQFWSQVIMAHCQSAASMHQLHPCGVHTQPAGDHAPDLVWILQLDKVKAAHIELFILHNSQMSKTPINNTQGCGT